MRAPATPPLESRRVCIVTGATNGLGREAARQLAATGEYHVVLACRNTAAAERVAAEIRAEHAAASAEVGPALDLGCLQSVAACAAELRSRHPRIDVLVNNAGANYVERSWTPQGVGALAQVNFLGPYALTRQLEGVLAASAARVVNVSSVTSRGGWIGQVDAFLPSWRPGSYYPSTKLANALFAFELQRRLGDHGVQSCAVDPGGVSTGIWRNSAFDRPPLSYFIKNLYAPPCDGAAAIVHAATVPWGRERQAAAAITERWARGGGGGQQPRSKAQALPDLRFYARGLFASPLVTHTRGEVRPDGGLPDQARAAAWAALAVVHSLLDWPLRRLSGGKLLSQTRPVPAPPLAYDESLAAQLWEVSAHTAGLPVQPAVPAKR